MKTAKYLCAHCGRRFEAEEKENLECPGCFWSTSVKKDEGRESEAGSNLSEGDKEGLSLSAGKKGISNRPPLKLILSIFLVLVLTAGIGFAAWPLVQSFFSAEPPVLLKKPAEKDVKGNLSKPGTAAFVNPLSEEEKMILRRAVDLTADRKPSAEEQKILDFHASYQTGLVEKLPSQAWTMDDFKNLIAERQRFYQVPLPGSYKRKIEKLFNDKYVPALAAFEQGNLQEARDLWAESLAFPVYGNDIQKHRGVVLTMLRPFINDTLSKIGAINNVLVEGKIREKEKAITDQYQLLFALIQNSAWQESVNSINQLESALQTLESPQEGALVPPPYPQGVALVDEGIRATLTDLLTPVPQGFADFGPLRQDIRAKKTVVISFLPDSLAQAEAHYQAGLQGIEKGDWGTAQDALRQVNLPLELAKDAQEKIRIIEKLKKAELDSAPKSG